MSGAPYTADPATKTSAPAAAMRPMVARETPPSTWPLSDEGRAAAMALAARLDRFEPAALVASTELKAVETAQAISDVLGLPVSLDEGLSEQRNETGGFQDQPVFEALRAWRRDEAARQHLPPYVIFHDRTLAEIAVTRPSGLSDLAAISGVGEGKLARYGEAVMDVLRGQ
ncbi:ATP-dependent DNA helicase RecQ [mine drainage metagenome]|uniref:ATP-dependent DNA helicase RecQ n=1 Tax=mine drainage metagenome TaxID=410659 RepID=A0A1J5QUY0_9ZZZZ